MENSETANTQKITEIFGFIFLLEKRWEYIADRELAPRGLTTKQWLMLAVIVHLFDSAPTIQEVAAQLNSSHQNVKAMALLLEKQGLLSIERDPLDRRKLRLYTTEENERFWEQSTEKDLAFITGLLDGLSMEEIDLLHMLIMKVGNRAQEIYCELIGDRKR
ncbi:MAG: MarR family transcriptional regulator [bacterium]|nr:MarR family transcriptional regulator [bacterium]